MHSSRLRFYAHMFFDLALGYPDRAEQERIICHIETEPTKTITLQQQQIERLKEYKTTLINSGVTGKIPAKSKWPEGIRRRPADRG